LSHLLFLRLVCSTAVAFAQQARPGLAEIVPIENYVNTTATSLFVSQDHQKFVTRLSGCGEFSSRPFFSFTVFRDDGQVQSNRFNVPIPGEFVAVSNQGDLWVAGIQCSDGMALARIDLSGELAWRAALGFGPEAIAVDHMGRGLIAGTADGMAVAVAMDPENSVPDFTLRFGRSLSGTLTIRPKVTPRFPEHRFGTVVMVRQK